ncbi:potassium channel family protein [Chitinilyticum litopenaei]|uniref:potassium channel family protein n=1 Tax=Chitinilyticum litopenaei TaxID=1121276 RepID=UPI0003FDC8EE|nr:potassium channel family protein [Chitinilyticum litopenaei]
MPLFQWLLRRGRLFQQHRLPQRVLFWTVWLLTLLVTHTTLIHYIEKLRWFDALWLTLTTVVTVGYGDLFPKTDAGRWCTIILLYGGSIFILGNLVGEFFQLLSSHFQRRLHGKWSYHTMHEHVIIIGAPANNPVRYLERLIDELRRHRDWENRPIVVISNRFEQFPSELVDRKVRWINGVGTSQTNLTAAGASAAHAVILVAANSTDADSDSYTLDTIDRLRSQGMQGLIVAECVKEPNRERMKRFGASGVVRVMHGYPEAIARAVLAPGAEVVLEGLFSSEGEECERIAVSGRYAWRDVLIALADAGIGTALACETSEGQIVLSPVGRTLELRALFVVMDDAGSQRKGDVPALLAASRLG